MPRRKMPVLDRLMAGSSVDPLTDCWNWKRQRCRKGYGRIKIKGISKVVHRISYEVHLGCVPDEMLVCHTCDNRGCINPDHLFLGTNADNMADMVAKGRQGKLRGEACGRAKLSESDVIAIRGAVGIGRGDLAEKYGISRASINDILSGRSWTHLEGAGNV